MANEIITTLHPDNDPKINLYPNIKKDNIPSSAVNFDRLDEDVKALLNKIGTLEGEITDLQSKQNVIFNLDGDLYITTFIEYLNTSGINIGDYLGKIMIFIDKYGDDAFIIIPTYSVQDAAYGYLFTSDSFYRITYDLQVYTISEYAFKDDIGNLTDLTTTNKTNVVSAINEVNKTANNTDFELINLKEALYGYVLDTTEVEIENTIPSVAEVNGTTYNLCDNVRGLVKSVNGKTAKSINLIPYPYVDTTKTGNGITFTDNGDGSISINGTSTNFASFNLSSTLNLVSGKTYYINSDYMMIAYKDSEGTNRWIGGPVSITWDSSYTFISVYIQISSGITIDNLIIYPMINEGSTALPYVPYFEGLKSVEYERLEIKGKNGVVTSTLLPYPTTLKGVGTARDTLEVVEQDNGLYRIDKVIRIGEVDMGTLSWVINNIDSSNYVYKTNDLKNIAKKVLSYEKANILCDRYTTETRFNTVKNQINNTISIGDVSGIGDDLYVCDNSYTDTDILKNSLSGVMLQYELATPFTSTIANDLTKEEVMPILELGGSVDIINSNSEFVNGSTTMEMIYRKIN